RAPFRSSFEYANSARMFPSRAGPDMNDTNTRNELFDSVRSLNEILPEMRAGQLVATLGELCADLHGRGLWDASDEELLEAAWQFRRSYEAATAGNHQKG
ncbi:MAG TPA: hypothetical protein VFT74_12165, partial [Isosphaeraceae bacterium]|nr:hypothetical protein [Isosphaeraceae bacterium]